MSAAPLLAQTNSYSAGTTYIAPSLTTFTTTGASMSGMLVSWTFAGGATGSATWGDLGGGLHGILDASGLQVSFGSADNTFSALWRVFNNTNSRLSSLRFNGAPGRTVFDCGWDGSMCVPVDPGFFEGTITSQRGWSLTSSGGSYAGGVSGFYTNQVAIAGNPAVGDLFEQLEIRFDDILGAGADYLWRADTDNTPIDLPPPVRVPEPATLAMTLLGFVGLGGVARRRRRSV